MVADYRPVEWARLEAELARRAARTQAAAAPPRPPTGDAPMSVADYQARRAAV
jgi:hypothetical protein